MIDARKQTSKTVSALLCAALLLLPSLVWAEHIPPNPDEPDSSVEFDFRLAFAPNTGILDPFVELETSLQADSSPLGLTALTAGAYLRVLDNLKVGAFYRLQTAARHDDDWVSDGSGGWSWEDSTTRFEHLLIGDITPRALLPFLPGEDWVGALKTRYIYNSFNGQQTLYFRPGLTYVHFVERAPIFNLGIAYGMGLSLNFGDSLIYTHDLYTNFIYHLSKDVKFEARVGWNRTLWEASEDAVAADFEYEYAPDVLKIGFGIILTPDME